MKLLICGEGAERENLESLIANLGLGSRARLLGFRRDISEIMDACDALVFPSVHEGLPVSVMEAMASGLPVIATKIRGIVPDLIEDGIDGLILESGKPSCIEGAARALLDSETLSDEVSVRSKAKAKKFSTDEVLPLVTKLYSEVLNR